MRVRLALGIMIVAAIAAAGCRLTRVNNLPPAERIMHPGPGVGGPGPGVIPPRGAMPGGGMPGGGMPGGMPGGAFAPVGFQDGGVACGPGGYPNGFPGGFPGGGAGGFGAAPVAQILFAKPQSMHIRWFVGAGFGEEPLITPGRYNFPQAAVYKLKLSEIEGRPGIELYPTLEIGPSTPRSAAYLQHNAIPIQFTGEDFDQVLTGNFVTKVIYLPDPEFQELALAGVETLVSTRLDSGVDPIVEADRRGAILAIIRMGNIDDQLPQATPGFGGEVVAPGILNGLGDSRPLERAGDDGLQLSATAIGNLVAESEAAGAGSEIQLVGYNDPEGRQFGPAPSGFAVGAPPSAIAPGHGAVPPYISGVNAPVWGMPSSGTPIGLPGPPHIPFGVPAGLQKHTMRNYTRYTIPPPTQRMNFRVKHSPGYVYPRPADTVSVHERTQHRAPRFRQPLRDRRVRLFNSFYGNCP